MPYSGFVRASDSQEFRAFLPSDVAAAVRLARCEGWTPTAPGSAFNLDQSAGFMPSDYMRNLVAMRD